MEQELKYSSENLFDIKCLKEGLLSQINELNIQKRVIDGKIALLYETIDSLERHILSIEEQNK